MTLPRFLRVVFTAFILWPASAHAQGQDTFVEGLTQLIDAARAADGGEPATMRAAVARMAEGLAEWDLQITGMEKGLAADIQAAPPPVAARMRAALGAAYLERGRADDALAQFARALALDAAFAEVQLLRGLAFQRAGRAKEAAAAFEAAWQRNKNHAIAAYLSLASASNRDPATMSALVGVLTSALERRLSSTDSQGARFFTTDLVDDGSVSEPLFAPAALKQGFDLVRAGRYDEAIVRLKTDVASGRTSRDERASLSKADALLASGDPMGARTLLRNTVRVMPDSGEALWKLGRLTQALGDSAEALQSYERLAALPLIAGNARVHAFIGQLRHGQFDLDAAAAAYRRRLEFTPNDSAAHFDLGEVYRGQDKLDEALSEYVVAALLDPDRARNFAMIGQVLASAGRDDQAVQMLKRAVDLDPMHLEARYGLSRALLRLGRSDEAQRELAVFEQMQKKAMEEERRRFLQNQEKIDEVLKANEGKAGR